VESDAIRKYLDAAVSFTQMTRQRAEELVHDLMQSGELNSTQATEWIEEMLERSRQRSETVMAMVRKELDDRIAQLNLVTREDLSDLAARITGTAKKGAGKKSAAKKAAAKQAAAKQAGVGKKAAGKAAAKQAAADKAPSEKAPSKKAAAKKAAAAEKSAAKKTAPKKTAPKKAAAKKAAAKKTPPPAAPPDATVDPED